MTKVFLLFVMLILNYASFSQMSDYIIVRKPNGQIIKSYSPGLRITMQTENGNYVQGPIIKIVHDSVYIRTYDIRQFLTSLGVTRVDTFRTFLEGFHIKEIKNIIVSNNQKSVRGKPDKILIFGGAGYIIMNLVNSIYLKQPISESRNIAKLAIAFAATTTGFLLSKLFSTNSYKKNKYEIEYVNMNK